MISKKKKKFLEINTRLSKTLLITEAKAAPEDAKEWGE